MKTSAKEIQTPGQISDCFNRNIMSLLWNTPKSSASMAKDKNVKSIHQELCFQENSFNRTI